MSQELKTQIVSTLADDDGSISASKSRVEQPDIDISINIRQDDLQMFWADDTQLLLRTSEMAENMYLQPIPSSEGYQCEVVVEPQVTLTETEPAQPAEQPDVSQSSHIKIRMD
jgi:hypothetical protein